MKAYAHALILMLTIEGASAVSPPLGRASEQLAGLVQTFVDGGEVVGAELLVLQDRKVVLNRSFGLRANSLFAMRSMTKPFTGMAAQVLIDEGRLELDAPVSRYLNAFSKGPSRDVTVRQLMTHRAGFPLGQNLTKPLGAYQGGLRELADLAGQSGPAFPPDTQFVYSDVGSDILGAVVAEVAGKRLEDFIREKILGPLELRDTLPEAEVVEPQWRDRVVTRYTGQRGNWSAYWSARDAPLYPFLKGSGGLFSTARDYGKFLQSWMDRNPIISAGAFTRALTPVSKTSLHSGFPDTECWYGQMWMIYRRPGPAGEVFGFGHSGSDGTQAYAFPKQNLIVCYLTQTRGNQTRGRFEAALSHLFLMPDPGAFEQLRSPAEAKDLQEFTGLYAKDNDVASLGAIVVREGTLAFEIPGRMLLKLRATDQRDRWIPEPMPNDVVSFRRKEGRVTGLGFPRGGRIEEASRFLPDPSLPTVDELMTMRTPPEALSALLPLRITSVLELGDQKLSMVESYGKDGASLTEIDLGTAGKVRLWVNGSRAWRQDPGGAPKELFGQERYEQQENSLAVLTGDWRLSYKEVTVIASEMLEGQAVWRVRTVPHEGIASTKLMSAATGALLSNAGLALLPGAGLRPSVKRYADFKIIEGLALPSAQSVSVGDRKLQITVTKIEPRIAIEPAAFSPVEK